MNIKEKLSTLWIVVMVNVAMNEIGCFRRGIDRDQRHLQ